MHGECGQLMTSLHYIVTSLFYCRQDAIQGGGGWGRGQWADGRQTALLLWLGYHCH